MTALLEHFRPAGPVEPPAEVKSFTDLLGRAERSPEYIAEVTTPSGIGRSCARWVLDQLAVRGEPPPGMEALISPQLSRDLAQIREHLGLEEDD